MENNLEYQTGLGYLHPQSVNSNSVEERIQVSLEKISGLFANHSKQISNRQAEFLAHRRQELEDLSQLIHGTWDSSGEKFLTSFQDSPRKILYDLKRLIEFSTGSLENALSGAYQVYKNRRSPRIPNGDLLLMTRVTSLTGTPGHVAQGGEVETDFDVPEKAWFLNNRGKPQIPASIWMEIALQPCGFLSAWLETPLIHPDVDYYFRNLDGRGRWLCDMPVVGRIIHVQASLIETTDSSQILLQRFRYVLSVEQQAVFDGEAVFGYFPKEALHKQAGLDGNIPSAPWNKLSPGSQIKFDQTIENRHNPTKTRLVDLDEVQLNANGGRYTQGYAYAKKYIHPEDWYFARHFYQDPVMPGSLGVESMIYILSGLIRAELGNEIEAISPVLEETMSWKYRGQILPTNKVMEVEVHVVDKKSDDLGWIYQAEGSLWVDGTRIYEVKPITLNAIRKGDE